MRDIQVPEYCPLEAGIQKIRRGAYKYEYLTNAARDYDADGLRFKLWEGGIKMKTK